MNRITAVLIAISLIALSHNQYTQQYQDNNNRLENEAELDQNGDIIYDYNLQVLEVPGTVCKYRSCDDKFVGNISSDSINYHGVWPNKLDGNHPFFCSSEKYDPNKLDDQTYHKMQLNWVGLYNSTFWFRFHEYTKHGTCFKIPQWVKRNMQTQKQFEKEDIEFNVVDQKQTRNRVQNRLFRWLESHQYSKQRSAIEQNSRNGRKIVNYEDNHQDLFFKTAEEMYIRSGIGEVIFKKSRSEESVWSIEELSREISEQIGVQGYRIGCYQEQKEQKQYLQELRFCWDKDELKMIECPGGYRSSCRSGSNVYVVPYIRK